MSIEITGLCKSFGGITALHDLTLTVEEGCVTCITGPSGCGKSTLLSILLGLLQPDAGQVKGLEGKRAAAVFQEDRLCERLSAIANILLVCEPEVSPQAACGMLERMGLEKQHHQKPVCDLSGGMRRRVALARALLAKSDWLALDEPFKGLDEDTRTLAIRERLAQSRGKTVLVITHDEQDIEALGARHIRLAAWEGGREG